MGACPGSATAGGWLGRRVHVSRPVTWGVHAWARRGDEVLGSTAVEHDSALGAVRRASCRGAPNKARAIATGWIRRRLDGFDVACIHGNCLRRFEGTELSRVPSRCAPPRECVWFARDERDVGDHLVRDGAGDTPSGMRRLAFVGLGLALACADEGAKETNAGADDMADASAEDDSATGDSATDDLMSGANDDDDVSVDDVSQGSQSGGSQTGAMTSADDDSNSGSGAGADDVGAADLPGPDDATSSDDIATGQVNMDDDAANDDAANDAITDESAADDGDNSMASADDDSSTSTDDSNDDSASGDTYTVTYSNCMACAESKCPTEYAACSANAPCSSLRTCLEACWNADDWDAYDQCSDDCVMSVDTTDAEANAIGIAIGYCIEEQCDESECLTHSVERVDDRDDDIEFDELPSPNAESDVEIEYDDGYLTAGPWHGYVWTQTDDLGSAITIREHEAGDPLCIATDVELASPVVGVPGEPLTQIEPYVLFGFNLNQQPGQPAPAPGTFSFEGYTDILLNEGVLVGTSANPPARIELWPAGADVDPSLRGCAPIFGLATSPSLRDFESCEDGTAWDYTSIPPIESIVFRFERFTGSPTQYCFYQLTPE